MPEKTAKCSSPVLQIQSILPHKNGTPRFPPGLAAWAKTGNLTGRIRRKQRANFSGGCIHSAVSVVSCSKSLSGKWQGQEFGGEHWTMVTIQTFRLSAFARGRQDFGDLASIRRRRSRASGTPPCPALQSSDHRLLSVRRARRALGRIGIGELIWLARRAVRNSTGADCVCDGQAGCWVAGADCGHSTFGICGNWSAFGQLGHDQPVDWAGVDCCGAAPAGQLAW